MLLEDCLKNDLVDIRENSDLTWQDAVRISGNKLVEHGYIKSGYLDEIIDNVNRNGPYIVIVPGVAMPHAMAESENVLGTAIGFTKFSNPVQFDPDNSETQAQLFFTLAAKDSDQHLKNISELSELLMSDGLIDKLIAVKSIEDLKSLVATLD